MMTLAVALRPAVPGDAAALAALAERTFRETFGPHNRAADVDAHCAATYGTERQARELADPQRHLVVAERDSELIGYLHLSAAGPTPACVTGPAPLELLRFYVDSRWHGRGVAQALMAHAFAAARARGARTLYLTVWENNPRAMAFYAKHGFIAVGAKPFILGADLQNDLVMSRPLAVSH